MGMIGQKGKRAELLDRHRLEGWDLVDKWTSGFPPVILSERMGEEKVRERGTCAVDRRVRGKRSGQEGCATLGGCRQNV